jgi:N-carbamoylputrescine amidase
MRAALIQHRDAGSREANLAETATQVREAARRGAQLVLLAELHTGPYFCQIDTQDHFALAEPIPGPSTEFLAELVREVKIVLVASLFEHRAPGVYHNTAVVFEADGSIAGQYRKMHIPDDPGYREKYYFTPGDLGFEPISTSVGRLGVLVCWDQWYPEAARLMALRGADLLLYPTAIGWDPNDAPAERERQREAWITVQRGHAVANHLPVLSCNRVGFEASPHPGEPGALFWGSSFVAGPQGEFLARAQDTEAEMLMADLDLTRTAQLRVQWPFLRDRRIDAYGDLLKRWCR